MNDLNPSAFCLSNTDPCISIKASITSMAALFSIRHALPSNTISCHELKTSRGCPRVRTLISCQRGEQFDDSNRKTRKDMEQDKELPRQLFGGVEKFGKGLKDTLSPRQKGDWKDIVLMSSSLAVYVYISQRIVCAYCAWTSLLKQPW